MRIEFRATPAWMKLAVPVMAIGALSTVFATVAVLKLARVSDGVVVVGAVGALVVTMTALVLGSSLMSKQRPVRFVLIHEGSQLVLTDPSGQRIASSQDGSLTLTRAVSDDYVRNRFVFRPAVLLRLQGEPVASLTLVGPTIDKGALPTIDRALPLERITDRGLFESVHARASS